MKPLGFVIITYNRPDDMLALARNIALLEGTADLLEEVIIVNNASTADYSEVREFISTAAHIPFRYIESAVNAGVAGGRNMALSLGRAPIVIMLDDDSELENMDALTRLREVFLQKGVSRPTAIVSFKVLYYETRQMQVNAFPHKRFEQYAHLPFLETYYYAGGAHAILREAIEKTGTYPPDFFYGMEEYDLSFRILDAGYGIVYTDSVVMLHKESPLGRTTRREKLRMMWVNKSVVAWRYLPVRYFWTTVCMWSLEYLRQTRFHLGGWLRGWQESLAIPRSQSRRPVSRATLDYLRQVKARLWY